MWAKGDRARRKDALTQAVLDIVVAWWTEETRVSPQKKDVRRKRVGVNKFITHAGHWLEESQVRVLRCSELQSCSLATKGLRCALSLFPVSLFCRKRCVFFS